MMSSRAGLRWFAVLCGFDLCTSCLAADSSSTHEQLVPDCTLEGAFTVELGEGLDGFTPIGEGMEPMLVYGAQGGTHLLLAARLLTPEPLERYEVTLTPEIASESCADIDCDFVAVGGFTDLREATLVDGGVEIPSLVLVVDRWDHSRPRRLILDVMDECGRTATDVRILGFGP